MLVARSVSVLITFKSAVVSSTSITWLSAGLDIPPVSLYVLVSFITSSSERRVYDDTKCVEALTVSEKNKVSTSEVRLRLKEISMGLIVSGEKVVALRPVTGLSELLFMSLMAIAVAEMYVFNSEVATEVNRFISFRSLIARLMVITVESLRELLLS